MKKKMEQFKKLTRSIFSLILLLCQTAIFAHTWIHDYNSAIVLPFVHKGNLLFYAIFFLILLFFSTSLDGLRFGTYRPGNLITGQILALLGALFVSYMQIVLLAAGFLSPVPLIFTFIQQSLFTILYTFGATFLFLKLFKSKTVLLIYDTYSPETFIEKLKLRKDIFTLKKIVNLTDGMDGLPELIAETDSVIIYDVHAEKRNKILKMCFESNTRAYTTSKVSDILIRGAESLHMFDTPLLLCRNIGLTFWERFVKRFFDILISALMLIVFSPLLLLCAIAIKIYDGGPVFFRQARGTIGGKIFYIHKFRSMIVNAEQDGAPKPCENYDPRITPVGKILRATRLDELPQLIDILFGNMSLVGPRPERIEHIKQYTEEIPEFSYRLKVKGGLTGYAQLYGKYNTTPYDKLQLDLMYIQNYSLLLDIRLLMMTVKIMFMKESTEGFSKEKSKKINEKSLLQNENKE